MLKWLKRIALGALSLALVALLAGVTFEQWSRWRLDLALTPPGKIVEVDGRDMHLNCLGEGTPKVILEAGWGIDGSSSWDPVLGDIASLTRVCAYDRAGILWSDPGPKPRSAQRIINELHALLVAAGEDPPYVLVGHSLGGPLVLAYADRYPDEVVGVVLIDASHPQQNERYPPEMMELEESMMPSPLLTRIMATTGLLRLTSSSRDGNGSEEPPSPMVAKLPQSLVGAMAEMESEDEILAAARAVTDLGDLRLVVLSSGRPLEEYEELPPGVSKDLAREVDDVHEALQRELVALSTRADQRVIGDAGHYIHHDRPDVVVGAITEVVEAARSDVSR